MIRSRHPAVATLEQLIGINSVNPHYDPGAAGERDMVDYLERRLSATGAAVYRQHVLPGRDNLIAELRTGHPERTLLLESHTDTVSFGGMSEPLVPRYAGSRLYGRGACDTKATLAGMLYAFERCAAQPERLGCDVVLCAAADEEHRYRGVLAFLENGPPVHGAIVGEPTELEIVVSSKGCARFAVVTFGRSAHSSVPHEGDNAIYHMMDAIRYIREQGMPHPEAADPLCGRPTLSVGTIRGGQQINIVPDRCSIEVDRRIIPGESPGGVIDAIAKGLYAHAASQGYRAEVETLLEDWALATPPDADIVRAARGVALDLGLSGELTGVPYGSDASKLQQLGGIPSIVFGPGSIAQAHADEEWVEIRDVETAAEFYYRMILSFGHM